MNALLNKVPIRAARAQVAYIYENDLGFDAALEEGSSRKEYDHILQLHELSARARAQKRAVQTKSLHHLEKYWETIPRCHW
jgi:hypothetical protein